MRKNCRRFFIACLNTSSSGDQVHAIKIARPASFCSSGEQLFPVAAPDEVKYQDKLALFARDPAASKCVCALREQPGRSRCSLTAQEGKQRKMLQKSGRIEMVKKIIS